MIAISGESYEIDPYCIVTVKEVGETSCDTTTSLNNESLLSSNSNTIQLVYIIGTSVMLLLVITLIIIIVYCYASRRKSKSYDIRLD